MKNRALGRGLSSLLKEDVVPVGFSSVDVLIDIDRIEIGNFQPRKIFDETKLRELANSIVNNGLIQPIIVAKSNNENYKIIAGERRFRACKIAGLKKIPVIIQNLSDKEILEIALIENIQREELTAIEEAEAYARLIKEFGYTQSELADSMGKSRSHVANLLRLNSLPDSIKEMVNNNQLTMGHARCLVGLEGAEEFATKIIANDLNVRQTEELVSKKQSLKKATDKRSPELNQGKIDDDMLILSQSLSEAYGVKVCIESSTNGGGRISFYYSTLEELDSILTKIWHKDRVY